MKAPGRSQSTAALHALGAVVILAAAFGWALYRLEYQWDWAAVWRYRAKFVQGWWVTLGLSAAALVGSMLVGVVLALARHAPVAGVRVLARLCVEGLRGTPLLVQLLVFFYIVAEGWGVRDRYVVGVAALSVFAGAYIAEILRGAVASVGADQWLSARAVGFTPAQTYRHVVAPQALRVALPPLAGQFASLVKDSSLLSVIAIPELTLQAQEVNAFTYATLEAYGPLAVGYLALTLPLSLWTQALERRAHYAT